MLTFKNITLQDIPALTPLFVATFNAPPWNDSWTEDTAAKRLGQMIGVPDFFGFYAYDEAGLCGLILGGLEQYGDAITFNLKEFCVDNRRRGQGLGSVIYRALETQLKALGVSEIFLTTLHHPQTLNFYTRQGLTENNALLVLHKTIN